MIRAVRTVQLRVHFDTRWAPHHPLHHTCLCHLHLHTHVNKLIMPARPREQHPGNQPALDRSSRVIRVNILGFLTHDHQGYSDDSGLLGLLGLLEITKSKFIANEKISAYSANLCLST